MNTRSLLVACALAPSMAWVAACGDSSTGPTQPAEPTLSGPELVVASNSWITRKNLPSVRRNLAVATVTNAAGQSIVYAIGGFTDVYPVSPLRKVTAYNVATNTWTERRPLPLASSNGAGVINGKIYVSGGFSTSGDAAPTRALYVYDPGTNTWTRKHDLPTIGGPTKDWTVGSNGVTGVINGKLYVVTRCSSRVYYTEDDVCEGDLTGPRLFRYNPVTDRWVTLAPPFPAATVHEMVWTPLAGGVIGGRFYVMGGLRYDPIANELQELDVTIVYDPVTNLWTRRASMPSPRIYMGGTTVLLNGKPRIEVVGGAGGLAADNLQYIP
jgi:N-acetylneuraminic acid mutarotase